MKTRVNLYTPAFRPQKERLTLTHIAGVGALVLAIMLFVVFLAKGELASVQLQLNTARSEITQLENSVQELTLAVENNVQDPVLKQQLSRLSEQLDYRHRLLTQLSNLSTVQSSGFSGFMSDLAILRDKDIRLTRITLDGETLTLNGAARYYEVIPRWIKQFEHGQSLAGREFNRLNIDRNKDGVISFVLTNKVTGAESE